MPFIYKYFTALVANYITTNQLTSTSYLKTPNLHITKIGKFYEREEEAHLKRYVFMNITIRYEKTLQTLHTTIPIHAS